MFHTPMLSFLEYCQATLEEQALKFNGQVKPRYGQVVYLSGSAGCFTGDTLVKTEKGYKQIAEIKEGELVYTLNETTGMIELKPVLKVWSFETDELVELTTQSGTKIECTPNHEIFDDGGWIPAKDIEPTTRATTE